MDDLTANIRNLASGRKVETPESKEAQRLMNFISGKSSPAVVHQQDATEVSNEPSSSTATKHEKEQMNRIQGLIADCSKPAATGRAEQTRGGGQQAEEKRLMDFIKEKTQTAYTNQNEADRITRLIREKEAKEHQSEADRIMSLIKENDAKERQKREKQQKDAEKKQKEHERFTEWVAWAQGEIAQKKATESSDEDA